MLAIRCVEFEHLWGIQLEQLGMQVIQRSREKPRLKTEILGFLLLNDELRETMQHEKELLLGLWRALIF